MADAPTLALAASAFVMGVASGVHCIGMCGGIVAAFSTQTSIVRIVRDNSMLRERPRLSLLVPFNLGRVGAYAIAGAIAGAVGGAGAYAAGAIDLQVWLFVVANAMLVLVGLYLAGLSPVLAKLETLGGPLWKHVRPLAASFLPAHTPARAFIAGSLWGWLPCGLVYAMLVTAVAAGSPTRGALAMIAFGLGTLPNLVLAGLAVSRMHRLATHPALRRIAGGVVLGFGLIGLARAADVAALVRRGLLCLDFG